MSAPVTPIRPSRATAAPTPPSALSEALGHHRFVPGDRVTWAKSLQADASPGNREPAEGRGTVLSVLVPGDPTAHRSTVYLVRDDEQHRDVAVSSRALHRQRSS